MRNLVVFSLHVLTMAAHAQMEPMQNEINSALSRNGITVQDYVVGIGTAPKSDPDAEKLAIYVIPAILFIIFGSPTLTGCSAKQVSGSPESVPIETLLTSINSYVGKTVEVYGKVYAIANPLGTNVTVRLSSPDKTFVQLLQCEFPQNNPPPATLKEGRKE